MYFTLVLSLTVHSLALLSAVLWWNRGGKLKSMQGMRSSGEEEGDDMRPFGKLLNGESFSLAAVAAVPVLT